MRKKLLKRFAPSNPWGKFELVRTIALCVVEGGLVGGNRLGLEEG